MGKNTFRTLIFLATTLLLLSYDLPKGWYKAGNAPDKYDMGVEKKAGRTGGNAATIKSTSERIKGFGTLMQMSLPDKYLGKRVRMTGYMKSVDVDRWAGFWFRVDGEKNSKKESLSFDNMSDRPVRGTTGWAKYEIVLNVPRSATNLAYGALIDGTGQIWFEDLNFEIVSDITPTTDIRNNEPRNLKFDE